MKEVLLVSSNDSLQQLLAWHATNLNISLVITNNLGKAWNKLNSTHKFSKIILDIYTPGQDGFEFSRDIKKFFSDLEIIGLTTNPVLADENSQLFTRIFLLPLTNEDYKIIFS